MQLTPKETLFKKLSSSFLDGSTTPVKLERSVVLLLSKLELRHFPEALQRAVFAAVIPLCFSLHEKFPQHGDMSQLVRTVH